MSPLLENLRLLGTCILLLGGSLLMFLAAYGLLKLPDVFCRAHAQTKATTLGIASILVGLWLHLGNASGAWALFFAILAQVLTIPVSSHMIALLAFQKKVPRFRQKKVAYHRGYQGKDLEK
jgi:multicomponent Na+:H+ antiporter subunit G